MLAISLAPRPHRKWASRASAIVFAESDSSRVLPSWRFAVHRRRGCRRGPSDPRRLQLLDAAHRGGLAAIIGDQVGYLIGHRAGPTVRPARLAMVQAGPLERPKPSITAEGTGHRPIRSSCPHLRTASVGASRMDYRKFVTFNVIGGTPGRRSDNRRFLVGRILLIRDHLEIAILARRCRSFRSWSKWRGLDERRPQRPRTHKSAEIQAAGAQPTFHLAA